MEPRGQQKDLIYKQFACAMENSDEDMSMKAVKRLGKSCKNLFKMDNARVLLLEMAKDYLNHSQLEEATDKQYGKGDLGRTNRADDAFCRDRGMAGSQLDEQGFPLPGDHLYR